MQIWHLWVKWEGLKLCGSFSCLVAGEVALSEQEVLCSTPGVVLATLSVFKPCSHSCPLEALPHKVSHQVQSSHPKPWGEGEYQELKVNE